MSAVATRQRLVFVVTSATTATTFLPEYLGFLQQAGWDVTLVCSDGPGISEMVERSGVRFSPLAMKREPSPFNDMVAIFGMLRILKDVEPSILVYATPKASMVGAFAGALLRIPSRAYELWGLRLETSGGFGRRVLSAIEGLTIRLSTVVVANSRSLAERAEELGLRHKRGIFTLGQGSSHGVDATYYQVDAPMPALERGLAKSLQSESSPVIGFVGRLHPDKGIDTLLAALLILVERRVKVQLMIVGEDEGAADSELMTAVARRIRVNVAGFLSDVRPALRAMDLLCLPSRREGFPNVVLEAAAMVVPAVVSDSTGCRDAVIDGVTGRIVATDDAVALADAVEGLLANDDVRVEMGRAARRNAVENYSPTAVWSRHLEVWERDATASETSHGR